MWEGWEEARHASALLIGLGQGGPAWDLPWEGGRLYFLGEGEDEDQPEDRRRSGEVGLCSPLAGWVVAPHLHALSVQVSYISWFGPFAPRNGLVTCHYCVVR